VTDGLVINLDCGSKVRVGGRIKKLRVERERAWKKLVIGSGERFAEKQSENQGPNRKRNERKFPGEERKGGQLI